MHCILIAIFQVLQDLEESSVRSVEILNQFVVRNVISLTTDNSLI